MKNLVGIVFFALFLSNAFSQTFEISEVERTSINGTYKSFLFELPDVDEKQAEEDWKKTMDRFNAKTKYDRKNKIWYAENVEIPQLNPGVMNIYASIFGEDELQKRTSVIVWFAIAENIEQVEADSLTAADSLIVVDSSLIGVRNLMAADNLITADSLVKTADSVKTDDSFNAQYALKLLTAYATTTSKNQAESHLKMEEKRLDQYVRDLKKLQKDNKGYNRAINKAKIAIAKNEKNIELNEHDQIVTSDEIETQKVALEMAKENSLATLTLTDSEMISSQKEAESTIKAEEKLLGSLEKGLKKLERNHTNYHKAIDKAENTIALSEMNIEINDRDQKNKIKDIDAQKEVIVLAKENVKKFIN